MNSGSSQDSTWTFGGAVAAPAAGESTAEEVALQSIDSSTEEDKARPTSVATPKTVPKAKNASRAATPSRPTSLGSRAAKGSGRESDAPSLPCDASSENDSEKEREESQSDRQSFQTELIEKFLFTKIAGFDQGARQEPNDDRAKDRVIRDG